LTRATAHPALRLDPPDAANVVVLTPHAGDKERQQQRPVLGDRDRGCDPLDDALAA
jgi:hypothetical protein